jgi:hypothetical protein
MEEADKKSKSESEIEIKVKTMDDLSDRKFTEHAHDRIWDAFEYIATLEKRVKALEEHLMSLDHGSEQGNHPNDGGWFQ